MDKTQPRIIFGNLVNELMTAEPDIRHARSLSAVSTRKIWLAYEGDCVITPEEIRPVFKEYACGLLQSDPNKITNYTPTGSVLTYLSKRLDHGDRAVFNEYLSQTPNAVLLPFALDLPTLNFAKQYNLPIDAYDAFPASSLIELIYRWNTKSGFRALAERLNLPIVPGVSTQDVNEVNALVHQFLPLTGKVIIKLDRGSNGYGHLVLDHQTDFKYVFAQHLEAFKNQYKHFTIESLLEVIAVPNITLTINNYMSPSQMFGVQAARI